MPFLPMISMCIFLRNDEIAVIRPAKWMSTIKAFRQSEQEQRRLHETAQPSRKMAMSIHAQRDLRAAQTIQQAIHGRIIED